VTCAVDDSNPLASLNNMLAARGMLADGSIMRTPASVDAGGVAATLVRAVKTQDSLIDQPWMQASVQQAMATLRAECSPISDMCASSA
jgi:xanthine dehydrogenase iron-sulfur cluster and FAD-binding subunit A